MTLTKTSALRLGIALFAASGVAHAQFPTGAGDTGEAEDPRRYTVEMIIFEYAENVGLGTEIFVAEPVEPDFDVADIATSEPVDTAVDADSVGEAAVDVDLGIRTLAREELTMQDTLARLERLDAYRPLMHFGWSQATVAEDQSPQLPLARFGTPPPGLDGQLQLYLNRFLHLDTFPERSTFGRDIVVEYQPLRYRIAEDRIMKNGETRYYDHPKIGVIAKVTRVEDEGEAASAGF